ncbi:MAG: extracellular solute-binding protein [Patescibacteria group bacterium]
MKTPNYTFLKRGMAGVVLVLSFSLIGAQCTGPTGGGKALQQASQPVVLQYWRVFDEQDRLAPIITAYSQLHPNVSIEYKRFRYEEYERALLEAFAEDRGPDIFSIPNNDIDHHFTKLLPLLPQMTTATLVEEGLLQKKKVPQIMVTKGLTGADMRRQFVDTANDDVIRHDADGNEQIMALPLAIDTLALYYNKDLLNNAGIADPPHTWQEFVDDVQKMTVVDENTGELKQSAAAFGAGANIQRSPDILATIMMQRGTRMVTGGRVDFTAVPQIKDPESMPAVDSMFLYTDFASPIRPAYTWSEDMPDSFEAFAQKRTAFFFGYSYHAQMLHERAPDVRFGVTPMPQFSESYKVTAANYWVEAVSKKTAHPDYAWDFIQFATAAKNVVPYLEQTGRPTALRELIESQLKKEDVGPFASQVLFARNWYHGRAPDQMEKAFVEAITASLASKGGGRSAEGPKLQAILDKAREKIQEGY